MTLFRSSSKSVCFMPVGLKICRLAYLDSGDPEMTFTTSANRKSMIQGMKGFSILNDSRAKPGFSVWIYFFCRLFEMLNEFVQIHFRCNRLIVSSCRSVFFSQQHLRPSEVGELVKCGSTRKLHFIIFGGEIRCTPTFGKV